MAFNEVLGSSDIPAWFILIVIWSVIWKGFALWKAGNKKQKFWFIALFIINTFGILDILYLYLFSKKK